ncbi:site-specific DNA-methyltransferase [Agrobacterium vitis]|uniref:DNA-methyltransferase n=1 Tax=Agrobacterium vitis TaxID=373 RepID=UPI0012E7000C|nr:site-specific DNA-methyltransferase [Agrobacterium vitis]MVA91593.1 site-specific DNA-methyltransferase [Agrobacterium vitis]MVB00502.1 site-specific DNA-methyltransferase [Agrobacterium vitis]
MITFLDGRVTLYPGDCLEVLRTITSDSIDCVVTSPPYWGLRDYGVEGQIGLEPTLAEHLAVMVGVFDEVRRVLKPTGTCWINYGDCYAAAPNGRSAADTKTAGNDDRTFRDKPFSTVGGGIKAKDLCMIPNRLAIALQDAGWWVRSEIIWGKTNPMPDSSGAYRPSTAHEKIFMLTKTATGDVWRARDTGEISFFPDMSERCGLITKPNELGVRWVRIGSFYDAETVRISPKTERQAKVKMPDGWDTGTGGHSSHHRSGREAGKTIDTAPKQRGHSRDHHGFSNRWDDMSKEEQQANGRYLRNYEPAPLSVWEMATKPFSEAHFATFPTELAERCILAGCPKGGLVLDPFGGAGTTALVALRHGRNAALIELNAEYAEIAKSRIEAEWRVQRKRKDPVGVLPLFVEAAQ